MVRVEHDGVFAPSYVLGAYHPRATPALGLTVDTAVLDLHTSVSNAGGAPVQADVSWQLLDASGAVVATLITTTQPITVGD